jgi:hypothetical protein
MSAVRGMPELNLTELFRCKPNLLQDCDHVVTATAPDGEFAGVVAARWVGGGNLFLQLAISLIQARYQRSPLLRAMWHTAFEQIAAGPRLFPAVIALRTYNPAAFQAMRVFAQLPGVAVYPRIDGGDQDPAMVQLAKSVAEQLGGGCPFDHRTGILRGAGVPLDLYSALPEGGREVVLRYFCAHLAAGDRLLCVLHACGEAAQQRICRAFGVGMKLVADKGRITCLI